ncbi:MAG: 2OG-Fe(II) oxygenase [Bacteriovoracaceae bacterium]
MLDQMVRDIKEKGWSFRENILTAHDMSLINGFFNSHRKEFGPAMVGKGQSRQRIESVRGDHTFWIDPLNPPSEFARPLQILEELKSVLNRELFLGAKEYECHLAYYEPGSFYQKHVDRFADDSSRVLSFVFYLHQNWHSGDGGELVLYGENEEVISPLPGSLIVFLSDGLPHEVRPAKIERRSFTGWMHSKIIY